jgi:hypothetical protein
MRWIGLLLWQLLPLQLLPLQPLSLQRLPLQPLPLRASAHAAVVVAEEGASNFEG